MPMKSLVVALLLNLGLAFSEFRDGPSFLHEPPNSVTFLNTSGTIIPCSAYGKPLPKVTWRVNDGDEAFDVPGLRHIRPDGSLVFLSFRADQFRQDIHATIYRCQLTNVVGTIQSRDVHVRAVILQDYTPQVFNEYVLPGNTGVLKCIVPNIVREFISFSGWRKEYGSLIENVEDNQKYRMLPTGELYIFNVTKEDTRYSFRCQTIHTLAKDTSFSSSSAWLMVPEAPVVSPAKINNSHSTFYGREGETITLACTGQGNPPVSYTWQKETDGRIFPLASDHRTSLYNGLLILQYATVLDSGKYICKVSNNKSEDVAIKHLIVSGPPSAYITVNRTTGEVGKPLGINCSVSGHPLREVYWMKDGRQIVGDGRIVFLGRDMLHISSVQKEDEGMYQCFVIGNGESAQSSTELKLQDIAPSMVATFPDELVHPETMVSLRCIAKGNPLPQVTWLASDGNTIPDTIRFRLGDYVTGGTQVVSYVNISDVKVQDGGDYSCLAKNVIGKVKHTGRLNVFGPPHIRNMKNRSAIAGENITLQCPVAGYPIETVIWYKDGVVLPVNHRQSIQSMGKLLINNLERTSDQGEYTCLAKNSEGQEAKASFYLRINVAPLIDSQPLPLRLYTVEGKRFKLLCSVLEGDPEIRVEWRKNGHPLTKGNGISFQNLDDSLVLVFGKVNFRDRGNYTCAASNSAATVFRTTEVIVKVPPVWLQEPSTGTVVLGNKLILNCLASGFPQPNITWKKSKGHEKHPLEFENLPSSFRKQIFKNGTLQIFEVSLTDSAHYLCQATNGVGAGLSRVIQVKVHIPPKFKQKFLTQNVRKGDLATLRCHARGEQHLIVLWQKEKQILQTRSHRRMEIEERTDGDSISSELTITSVDRSDSGLYTCIVSNSYGKDESNTQLVVQELPSAPLSVVVKRKTARSITLEWTAPFNGNSAISRYVVQFRNGTASWQGDNIVSAADKEIIVQGLIPAIRYSFRVQAVNEVGQGPPSEPIVATTDEEAPGGPPTDINVDASGSQSIKVQWKPPRQDLQYGEVKGYYIGYKEDQAESYQYKNNEVIKNGDFQTTYLTNLNKNTRYGIMVQAYNSVGAGPRSDEVFVTTLEAAPPTSPVIMVTNKSPTSISVHWERPQGDTSAREYVLHYKIDGEEWRQEKISTHLDTYVLKNLKCGTKYKLRMIASNSLGNGEPGQTIIERTSGAAPRTPSKDTFIISNTTSVLLNLAAWHTEGCPIEKFSIQYKSKFQRQWQTVPDRVPYQNDRVVIRQLIPNMDYMLKISAFSEAGTTEAEFSFRTLNFSIESTNTGIVAYPPVAASDQSAFLPFYRNLTIAVPVIISAVVLLMVIIAVVLCFRRHGDSGSGIGSTRDESTYDRINKDRGHEGLGLTEYPIKVDKLHDDVFSKSSYYASPSRKPIPISSGRRSKGLKDESHEYAEPYSAIQSTRSFPDTISEFEYSTNIKNEGPYATIKRSPPRTGSQFVTCSGDKVSKMGSGAMRSTSLAYSGSIQSGSSGGRSSSHSSDIYKSYTRSEIS